MSTQKDVKGASTTAGTGLWLVRFVIVTFKPQIEKPSIELNVDGIRVRTLAVVRPKDSEPAVLMEARQELDTWPVRTPDGTILVPKDVRNRLEEWLEYAANLVAVGDTVGRQISSPSVSVAFSAKTHEAEQWLADSTGYKSQESKSINSGGAMRVNVEPEILGQFGDRLDGISLLAEALSQNTALSRFRDLIRLFERAFRTPSGKLGQLLVDFLDKQYGYTLHEITQWLDLRDRATHADVKPGHKIAYEKDVFQLIGRLQQAAYDVLMNKKTWQTNDIDRVNRWAPDYGSSSTKGGLFITQGRAANITISILDGFGSYPLNLGGVIDPLISQSAEDTYWFKRVQQDVHAQGPFKVLRDPDRPQKLLPQGETKSKDS